MLACWLAQRPADGDRPVSLSRPESRLPLPCHTDKLIYVCEVGKKEALRSFDGHEDEVNYISWDRTGHYLASCSDDCTSRVRLRAPTASQGGKRR